MEEVVKLTGTEADLGVISAASRDAVYILDAPETDVPLDLYIDNLHRWGIKNRVLANLRICANIPLGDAVRFESGDAEASSPRDMAELAQLLDPAVPGQIIVLNDDRTLLTSIVQQLVYLDYPITQLSIGLAREARDQVRTERFLSRLDALLAAARSASEKLESLEQGWSSEPGFDASDRDDLSRVYQRNLDSYASIADELKKARSQEVKLAVAASKKTGKSTIVNNMIGRELAPTSMEVPTPNLCIYRKSPDGRYHLVQEGSDQIFPDSSSVTKHLLEVFDEAQRNDIDVIPDMEILYASNRNGFEAYTVYDTPGPDRAEAEGHWEAAYRAVEACDVELFAIDFRKALTTAEEQYLRDIKKSFDEHEKIHTLVFTVNRIDEAFEQKGAFSKIRQIEGIRRRLRQIDPGYTQCVIFATSAQAYFQTLELDQIARSSPAVAPLLEADANWLNVFPLVLDDLLDEDAGDDVMLVINGLNQQAQNLRYRLGMQQVDRKVMQDFSGMPQLMRYVSYIAQSKARDEILNDITFTIASLVSSVGDVASEIQNVRAMMNASQRQIERIAQVLSEYDRTAAGILVPDTLTAQDVEYLRGDSTQPLRRVISPASTCFASGTLPLADLTAAILEHIRSSYSRHALAEALWPTFKQALSEQLSKETWEKYEKGNAEIQLSPVQLQRISQAVQKYIESATAWIGPATDNVAAGLQDILEHRFDLVAAATAKCQQELEHEDFALDFPQSPAFSVVIRTPDMASVGDSLRILHLGGSLSEMTEDLWGIHQFFRNVFRGQDLGTSEVQIRNMPDAQRNAALERDLKPVFEETLRSAGVFDQVEKHLAKTADSAAQALNEVVRRFGDVSRERLERIHAFSQIIDDRDRYQERLAVLENKERFINEITDAAESFTQLWSEISPQAAQP